MMLFSIPLRYLEVYRVMLRNSLIREMNFKLNFLLWICDLVCAFDHELLDDSFARPDLGLFQCHESGTLSRCHFQRADQVRFQLASPGDRRHKCSSSSFDPRLANSVVAGFASTACLRVDAVPLKNPLAICLKSVLQRKFLRPTHFLLHRYSIAIICSPSS